MVRGKAAIVEFGISLELSFVIVIVVPVLVDKVLFSEKYHRKERTTSCDNGRNSFKAGVSISRQGMEPSSSLGTGKVQSACVFNN